MSHIPNSAMPRAVETQEPSAEPGLAGRMGRIGELARENPGTTAAAGAAVLAGAIAAVSIPFLRARQNRKPNSAVKRRKAKNSRAAR